MPLSEAVKVLKKQDTRSFKEVVVAASVVETHLRLSKVLK